MDTFLCDELLQEIFRRLPHRTCDAASLVSKRWHRLIPLSQTSLSLSFYPRYPSLPSLSSFLSLRPSLSSLSICAATSRFSSDDLLLAVASSCPNLKCLRFITHRVSLLSLLSLSTSCPLLSSLTITLPRPLSFKWLYSFPSLKHLSVVCSSEIIPHDDSPTADAPQLKLHSLTISCAREEDHAINWLWTKCPNLKKLRLTNCQIPKDAPFSCFIAIQQVQFKCCWSFADWALSQLADTSTSLNSLSLNASATKQGLLHYITRNTCTIRKLDLCLFNELDDALLLAIAQYMRGLSTLRLRCYRRITGQGLKTLALALGDDLREFALMDCDVIYKEPGLLAALAQNFTRLRKLDLSYNKKLDDKELIPMLVSIGDLVDLKLKRCCRLTNAIAEPVIKNCKYLESVDIMECSEIGIQGVELFVKNCPRLRRIHVEQHNLSDAARTWAFNKLIEVVSG